MHILLALLLAFDARVAQPAPNAAAEPLHCRASGAAGTARRCSVAIPAARSVKVCTAPDASAKHCATRDKKKNAPRLVAWVVASPGAKCRIDRKRTDWSTSVTARLSKKSPATATCDLHVELT